MATLWLYFYTKNQNLTRSRASQVETLRGMARMGAPWHQLPAKREVELGLWLLCGLLQSGHLAASAARLQVDPDLSAVRLDSINEAVVKVWTDMPLSCLIADRAYDGDAFRTAKERVIMVGSADVDDEEEEDDSEDLTETRCREMAGYTH